MSDLREKVLMKEDSIDLNSSSSVAFIRYANHPCGYAVNLIAPNAIRTKHASITLPGPMPKYGTHTREILLKLGQSPDDIELLIDKGIVATEWSKRYLPD